MSQNLPPQSAPAKTSSEKGNLREEFKGKSVTLNVIDPISIAIVFGILIAAIASAFSGDEKKQPKTPSLDDLVITRTGKLEEDKVVKNIQGLKPGQVYTYGEELGFTRQIQTGNSIETGGSANLSFFGLAGVGLEAKFSKSLDVAIGQSSTETHQISISGDKCPNHEIKVTKVFETAVVEAPQFSNEKIPFRIQTGIYLSADDLCAATP